MKSNQNNFISFKKNSITKILLKKGNFVIVITTKKHTMGNLLYTIAVILIIIWAIGFLGGFVTSGIVHILLVIAIIAIILRVIQGRKPL